MKSPLFCLTLLSVVLSGCATTPAAVDRHATNAELTREANAMLAEKNRESDERERQQKAAEKQKRDERAAERDDAIAKAKPEIADAIRASKLVVGMNWIEARAAIGDLRPEGDSQGIGGADSWSSHYTDAEKIELYFHDGRLVRWSTYPRYN